jgi:hypothetical protein
MVFNVEFKSGATKKYPSVKTVILYDDGTLALLRSDKRLKHGFRKENLKLDHIKKFMGHENI